MGENVNLTRSLRSAARVLHEDVQKTTVNIVFQTDFQFVSEVNAVANDVGRLQHRAYR